MNSPTPVESKKEFENKLLESKRLLVVVQFWAEWSEQCKQMKDVVLELAKQNANVKFLNVEAEALPDVSNHYKIEAVPTFLFLKNKQVIGRLDGSNAPELRNLVKKHIDTVPPMAAPSQDPKTVLTERLKALINSAPCVLFMKVRSLVPRYATKLQYCLNEKEIPLICPGNRRQPKCGFSRQMVTILNDHNCAYSTFDILQDDQVRQGLKEYSEWPTFPQLYVNGELIGGLDIVKDMAKDNELKDILPNKKQKSITERIEEVLGQHKVLLFMKGDPSEPRCGFSRQIVQILGETGTKYSHFDILKDEDIRQGLKTYSDWPTFPQLYVDGELIGGLDLVKEMREAGELRDALNGHKSS